MTRANQAVEATAAPDVELTELLTGWRGVCASPHLCMSATNQRDRVATLSSKCNPAKALAQARRIVDPWLRAQALSWVARFTDGDVVAVAAEAAKASRECEGDYKKSAARAWEVAALADQECAAGQQGQAQSRDEHPEISPVGRPRHS